MRDEYIPYSTTVDIYAPFRPFNNKIMQWLRPLLRALHLLRPGWFPVRLREMDIDHFFEYSTLQIREVEEALTSTEQPADFWKGLVDGYRVGRDIERKKPGKFAIATGIDDLAWFSALQPSERRRLEEAIDTANPDLKKKLNPIMETITRAMLSSVGLTFLTSSPSEGTDQPMK